MVELLNLNTEFPESFADLPEFPSSSPRGTPPICYKPAPGFHADCLSGWDDACFGCLFSSRPF